MTESPEIRKKVRGRLMTDAGLTETEAVDVEIGVYNWSLKEAELRSIAKSWKQSTFVLLYAWKARSVITNFDPGSITGNTRLRDRMRSGEFLPHDVPFMKPFEVFPERWKDVLDSKVQREEFIYNEKPTAMTNQFKCGRCKQRECIYRELQLRSCDEPASLFISCLKCGNNWRIG